MRASAQASTEFVDLNATRGSKKPWRGYVIPASVLSRFVAQGRGLRSENIDKLCAYLGLVLTTKPGKARKGR